MAEFIARYNDDTNVVKCACGRLFKQHSRIAPNPRCYDPSRGEMEVVPKTITVVSPQCCEVCRCRLTAYQEASMRELDERIRETNAKVDSIEMGRTKPCE